MKNRTLQNKNCLVLPLVKTSLTLIRSCAAAVLTLASIQAAAGPHGGPTREERAKMDDAVQTACGADFTSFCPTATDHHAKMYCLRSNEADLSTTCSTFMAEMKARRPPGRPPGPKPDDSSDASSTNTGSSSRAGQ